MNLNEYKEYIIRLVEERGVAASKEDRIIKFILTYIQGRISRLGENYGKEIEFVVPSEILDSFSFLYKPIIKVKNTDITQHAVIFKNGSGSCTVNTNNMKIYNGKLCNITINIHSYSVMNRLVDKTFLNSLYHELNHLYDIFQNYQKNGNLNRYTKDVNRTNISNIHKCKEYWKEAFYRLFSKTELNALIASVYGDLMGIKSQRGNFHNDYKITLAYKAYRFFLDNLDYVLSSMDEESTYSVIKQIKNNNIFNINNDRTIDDYKRFLKRLIKNRCAKLLKGVGRTASLYYDRSEDVGQQLISCDYGEEIYNKNFF